MDSVEEYARRYSLSRLLSPDLLEALRPQSRDAGGLFIRAGGKARDLLFFVEGRVKAYSTMENGQSVLAAFYRPFDVLGEAEVFASDRYTLAVEAIGPSVCLALSVAAIKKAADRNCRLFMYLCGRLGAGRAGRDRYRRLDFAAEVHHRRLEDILLNERVQMVEVYRRDLLKQSSLPRLGQLIVKSQQVRLAVLFQCLSNRINIWHRRLR